MAAKSPAKRLPVLLMQALLCTAPSVSCAGPSCPEPDPTLGLEFERPRAFASLYEQDCVLYAGQGDGTTAAKVINSEEQLRQTLTVENPLGPDACDPAILDSSDEYADLVSSVTSSTACLVLYRASIHGCQSATRFISISRSGSDEALIHLLAGDLRLSPGYNGTCPLTGHEEVGALLVSAEDLVSAKVFLELVAFDQCGIER